LFSVLSFSPSLSIPPSLDIFLFPFCDFINCSLLFNLSILMFFTILLLRFLSKFLFYWKSPDTPSSVGTNSTIGFYYAGLWKPGFIELVLVPARPEPTCHSEDVRAGLPAKTNAYDDVQAWRRACSMSSPPLALIPYSGGISSTTFLSSYSPEKLCFTENLPTLLRRSGLIQPSVFTTQACENRVSLSLF
jgi:hypothetical protein